MSKKKIQWHVKGVVGRRAENPNPELRMTGSYVSLNRAALEMIDTEHIRVGTMDGRVFVEPNTPDVGVKLSKGTASRRVHSAEVVRSLEDGGAKRGVYEGKWDDKEKMFEFSWVSPIRRRGSVVQAEAKEKVKEGKAEVKSQAPKPSAEDNDTKSVAEKTKTKGKVKASA